MKVCSECQKARPLEDFYRSKHGAQGRRANCKDCQNARTYAWRNANRQRYLEIRRDETRRVAARASMRSLSKYGLTEDDYVRMLAEQQDVCAVCGNGPGGRVRRLCVDHCHDTGKVRGLLCDPCNRILGMIKDSKEHAHSMADYIDKYRLHAVA
jgi:hypothetical protein